MYKLKMYCGTFICKKEDMDKVIAENRLDVDKHSDTIKAEVEKIYDNKEK